MKKRDEHKKEESPSKSESPKSTSWFDFSEISLFGEKRRARLSLTSAFRYEKSPIFASIRK